MKISRRLLLASALALLSAQPALAWWHGKAAGGGGAPSGAWPGQAGNLVGHANTPAVMPTFNAPTVWPGGAWPGAWPGSFTGGTDPNVVSGSAGNPRIYAFCDFTGGWNVIAPASVAYVTFVGCRFQMSNGSNTGGFTYAVSFGANCHDISFFYCSTTPFTSQATQPPGGFVWPTSGYGVSPAVGDGNTSYQLTAAQAHTVAYNLYTPSGSPGGPPSGLVQIDHCDMWGYGAAVAQSGGGSGGTSVTDCWMHDGGGPQYGWHTNVVCDTNYGSLSNFTTRHCVCTTIGNSNNIGFQNNLATNYNNIIVDNCLIAGTHSNLICMGWSGSGGAPAAALVTNTQFTNNIVTDGLQWVFNWLYGDESLIFISNSNANGNRWRNNKFVRVPGGPGPGGSWQAGWPTDGSFLYPNTAFGSSDYP